MSPTSYQLLHPALYVGILDCAELDCKGIFCFFVSKRKSK
jgi:hypothetical protein